MTRPVTVITTVLNELGSIDAFVEGLDAQTRAPDEVVVVDAGSTDGTIERLRSLATSRPWLRVVVAEGNRSHGRNVAVREASNALIAATDAGCSLDRHWLERIAEPFEDGATWVAGFYEVDAPSVVDRCVGLTIVFVLDEVDPDAFLPSARSMAFTKAAWESVGGFPEHVEFGEDTLFDVSMVEQGHKATFVPDAIVGWHPPRGFTGLARTTFRWGRGDGAAHVRGGYYKRTAAAFGALGLTAAVVAVVAPRLLPLVAVPTVPAIWKTIRYKLRHESHPARFVLLPAARVTATSANLAGYLVGRYVGEPARSGS